ncbi:MAG: winged helix-turn-helix domain-containing protein [Acidobacteria bacterium]|nr:winged helix-turn-helix domain-containing protein [Acidobacteriota bacterium]
MPQLPLSRREYVFAGFRLSASILEHKGRLVPLSPKAIDTLYYLVARAPEIVGKDELMNAVWPDTFVVESGLARNVSLIRKTLEEHGGPGSYIETIPKRGYRFVAPIEMAAAATEGVETAPETLADPGPAAIAATPPSPEPSPEPPPSAPPPPRMGPMARRGALLALVAGASVGGLALMRRLRTPETLPYEAPARIGRYLLEKGSPMEAERALKWFEAAVVAQPRSAAAHAGLAETLIALYRLASGPEDALLRARTEAEIAVGLDPRLPEAHATLGAARMSRFDFVGAEQAFVQGLKLDRLSVLNLYYFGQLLSYERRFEEGAGLLKRAIVQDPVSPYLGVQLGRIYYSRGDFQQAAQQFGQVLEREEHDSLSHYYLGLILGFLGRHAEAQAQLEQARLQPSVLRTDRAWLALQKGDRGPAEAVYLETKAAIAAGDMIPTALLLISVAMGRFDEALALLEGETRQNSFSLIDLQADPRLEPLRRQPRYPAIARQLFGAAAAL